MDDNENKTFFFDNELLKKWTLKLAKKQEVLDSDIIDLGKVEKKYAVTVYNRKSIDQFEKCKLEVEDNYSRNKPKDCDAKDGQDERQ